MLDIMHPDDPSVAEDDVHKMMFVWLDLFLKHATYEERRLTEGMTLDPKWKPNGNNGNIGVENALVYASFYNLDLDTGFVD